MPEPLDIDAALKAKLGADTMLLSYMTNGVYWEGEVPQGLTRFVSVSLVSPREVWQFQGVSHVEAIYRVMAIVFSTVTDGKTLARSAAGRINELLHQGSLTVTGYSLMTMDRAPDETPWIHETEVDDVDPMIRWYSRGGHYRVVMST